MIACYHLKVAWSDDQRPILNDVSFEIPSKSWVQCTGPSGCGKSLLYAMLSLQCMPKSGQLIIGGRNLTRLGRFKLPGLRRRMGTCAQDPSLLESRTVRENLLLPFVARRQPELGPEAVHQILTQLEMMPHADLPVYALSAQEKRIIAIARAIVGFPEMILIDGGLAFLDESNQRRLLSLLRQAHDQGSIILMFSRRPINVLGVSSIDMRLEHGQVRLVERVHQSPSPENTRMRRR